MTVNWWFMFVGNVFWQEDDFLITDGQNPKVAPVYSQYQNLWGFGCTTYVFNSCNLNHRQNDSIACVISGGLPRFGLGIRHLNKEITPPIFPRRSWQFQHYWEVCQPNTLQHLSNESTLEIPQKTRTFEAAFFPHVDSDYFEEGFVWSCQWIIRLIQSRMEGSIRSHDLRPNGWALMRFQMGTWEEKLRRDRHSSWWFKISESTTAENTQLLNSEWQNDIWNLNSQCSRFTGLGL